MTEALKTAVLIPCTNEEATIDRVIKYFRLFPLALKQKLS